jgi:hypothetical protein
VTEAASNERAELHSEIVLLQQALSASQEEMRAEQRWVDIYPSAAAFMALPRCLAPISLSVGWHRRRRVEDANLNLRAQQTEHEFAMSTQVGKVSVVVLLALSTLSVLACNLCRTSSTCVCRLSLDNSAGS